MRKNSSFNRRELRVRRATAEFTENSAVKIVFLSLIIASSLFYLSNPYKKANAAFQPNIRIREINPVVNENNLIKLTAVDLNDQVIPDAVWESGSPDIAAVDPATGMIRGVKRGFATITARRGNDSFSAFVVVARVERGAGVRVPGDNRADRDGAIYISDPVKNVIMRKSGFAAKADAYAGKEGMRGFSKEEQIRSDALFAGPTAVALDNSADGGVYVTDTLNHSIRKIGFDDNDKVTTVIGNGSPGTSGLSAAFDQAQFNGPRGISAGPGGNLFIADTDNHAVYIADLANKQVRLLAGNPGASGKADGIGGEARFKRPIGLEVSQDGLTLALADSGNNRVRLIDLKTGRVSTISSSTSFSIKAKRPIAGKISVNQTSDEIEFPNPQSVSFDSAGNIYVVDDSGVKALTFPANRTTQVVSLAQAGTFDDAVSVEVDGTNVIVLDQGAETDDDSVLNVTVGGPEITGLSEDESRIEGGKEIIVAGKSFAPESRVFLADAEVENVIVESATRIRFTAPTQSSPGRTTLSVRTRGGVAQTPFFYEPPPLDELDDGEITTFAGGRSFVGDGGPAVNAVFTGPTGLALDARGRLYIADPSNNRVRLVDFETGDSDTGPLIFTIAGTGVSADTPDAGVDPLTANLTNPADVAIDSAGNFYTNDFSGIYRINIRTGKTELVASLVDTGPSAYALDSQNNLYIADADCNCIRRVDAKDLVPVFDEGQAAKGVVIAGFNRPEGGFSGDGDLATKAELNVPTDIAFDAFDNIYIADAGNSRIRRIDAQTGIITTVAGNGSFDFSGDGGPATDAALLAPIGVAADASGNIFIADTDNNRIRRVDGETGIITTVAGIGTPGFTGDGDLAVNAQLNKPVSVAVDGSGNLYISDIANNRIRFVLGFDITDENGNAIVKENTIFTIAGRGLSDIDLDMFVPAVRGRLLQPQGAAVSIDGTLLISDTGFGRVQIVNKDTKLIGPYAGLRIRERSNDDGGPAVEAFISAPTDLAIDSVGNLLILDSLESTVRRVFVDTATIETFAGMRGDPGFNGDGIPANQAILNFPLGIALDSQDNLYIADAINNRVRKVDAQTGIITTVAGSGAAGFSGDGGQAANARLNFPSALAFDSQGNLFIGDTGNKRIRRVDAQTSIITTIAGTGELGNGAEDGDGGPALRAAFSNFIGDLVFDSGDNLFIADTDLGKVRRIDRASGIISKTAGGGSGLMLTGDGGPAVEATLRSPRSLTIDVSGNLYIADTFNDAVRVVKGAGKPGGGQPQATITNVAFAKPNLIISGSGFGSAGAAVSVNGRDVSPAIVNQSDGTITLKGNKKKLNLKRGPNQIAVTAGGVTSNTFVFNF